MLLIVAILAARFAEVSRAAPNLWEWIATTTSVDSLVTGAGSVTIAILFASDRILTKGQHERRTADLVAFHARELAEITRSRDGWKEAHAAEKERADKATSTLDDMSKPLESIVHVLASLDRALPHPPKDPT